MNQSTLNAFLNQQESIGNYSKIAQERPRGATPWLRSGAEPEKGYPHPGAGAERSKPMAEQQQLHNDLGSRNLPGFKFSPFAESHSFLFCILYYLGFQGPC